MTKAGEAYGFFYYGGKTADIEASLPDARDNVQTPNLEVLLAEGIHNELTSDPALTDILQMAKIIEANYVLKASVPGTGNKRAAELLGNVMNHIYYSLFSKDEPFVAGIAYKRGEKYVTRHA